MPEFKITKTNKSRYDLVNWDNLGFGVYLSDHMYMSQHDGNQWNEGEIIPYGPMQIEPAMCTLHYGQSIFEGLKAYRDVNGGVNIFRPDMNAKRLNRSAAKVCIPAFPEEQFVKACVEITRIDNKFIPKTRGHSLYLRPVCYGDGNFLGVHSSNTFRLIIMTSPVASYYSEGLNPLKIKVEHEHVRAVRGGLGSSKTAANYAASLLASTNAKKEGFSQVLWLDGVERTFVDEVGAMNIMFMIDDELITPPLGYGSILAGVTRYTVLTLAGEMGLKVSERPINIDEIYEAHSNGKLQEVFGTGTAAVISPVGVLTYKGKDIAINNKEIGYYAQKFYDTITGIQYGEIEDKHRWNVHFDID